MDIFEPVNDLSAIKSVPVSELNHRATLQPRPVIGVKKDLLDGIQISEEYQVVKKLIDEGCPVVFVTGNAGTGKSTLIRYLRTVLEKKHVVVAPTGVAALNVQGATIHSFFHFPPKIHEEGDIKLVYDRKLYQMLELLIIDEVSMVRCDLMDSIDKFFRRNRSSNLPFGGVQLLLVGDLFQLPPVVPKRERDVLREKGYVSEYFFSSFSLQKTSLTPYNLTTTYRQEDQNFIDLLNKARMAEDLDSVVDEVNRQCYRQGGSQADITLTCTNNQADQINRRELSRLLSKEHGFTGKIQGKFRIAEDKLPSPINLKLKVGAHVMFTKNDSGRCWVNGTLGIVQDINSKSIRVKLVNESSGMVCDVHQESWETYEYVYDSIQDRIVAKEIGRYTQYPLMLAWAVTIHKSQGKTLDRVLLDFGNGAFASGQAYVALSRCRSIEEIRVCRPIQTTDIKCDPIIKRFHKALDTI
jgi:ATP-dependent DNA helicase PIF1